MALRVLTVACVLASGLAHRDERSNDDQETIAVDSPAAKSLANTTAPVHGCTCLEESIKTGKRHKDCRCCMTEKTCEWAGCDFFDIGIDTRNGKSHLCESTSFRTCCVPAGVHGII